MAIQGDVARYLSGVPVSIPDCNIAVTQPTIRDICVFGEDYFLMCLGLFNDSERTAETLKEGNSQLKMYDDFQILLVMLQQDSSTKKIMLDLFALLFPDYDCQFDNGCINFRQEKGGKILGQVNPRNFGAFKEILHDLFFPPGAEGEEDDFNPINDAAAAIAEKLREARKKRAEAKKKEEGSGKQSLFATYTSVLSVGLGLDINVLFGYTPFQLYDAFTRYTNKMSYDLYQRIVTTPLMDASKMDEPKNWIGSIY